MTCICGVVKGETVFLGGDSAATGGNLDRTIIKDPKVFVRGPLALGVCGLPKVMDALFHAVELPEQTDDEPDRSFMVGKLIPAIRDGLKKLDCTVDDPNYGTCFHGGILIGYRGMLYNLEGNFQLVVAANGYNAIGSGGPAAMGSLRATRGDRNARKRVLKALEAAAEENAGVAPPFVIVSVKKG